MPKASRTRRGSEQSAGLDHHHVGNLVDSEPPPSAQGLVGKGGVDLVGLLQVALSAFGRAPPLRQGLRWRTPLDDADVLVAGFVESRSVDLDVHHAYGATMSQILSACTRAWRAHVKHSSLTTTQIPHRSANGRPVEGIRRATSDTSPESGWAASCSARHIHCRNHRFAAVGGLEGGPDMDTAIHATCSQILGGLADRRRRAVDGQPFHPRLDGTWRWSSILEGRPIVPPIHRFSMSTRHRLKRRAGSAHARPGKGRAARSLPCAILQGLAAADVRCSLCAQILNCPAGRRAATLRAPPSTARQLRGRLRLSHNRLLADSMVRNSIAAVLRVSGCRIVSLLIKPQRDPRPASVARMIGGLLGRHHSACFTGMRWRDCPPEYGPSNAPSDNRYAPGRPGEGSTGSTVSPNVQRPTSATPLDRHEIHRRLPRGRQRCAVAEKGVFDAGHWPRRPDGHTKVSPPGSHRPRFLPNPARHRRRRCHVKLALAECPLPLGDKAV